METANQIGVKKSLEGHVRDTDLLLKYKVNQFGKGTGLKSHGIGSRVYYKRSEVEQAIIEL